MLDHPPSARCCTHKSEPSPHCTTELPGSSHQSPPRCYLEEVDGVGQSETARAKMFYETESNPAPGNVLDPVKQNIEMLE